MTNIPKRDLADAHKIWQSDAPVMDEHLSDQSWKSTGITKEGDTLIVVYEEHPEHGRKIISCREAEPNEREGYDREMEKAIEQHDIDRENPPLDDAWFDRAEVSYEGWVSLSCNIDRDVLQWYQAHWKKYRTRMNQVLRAYFDRKLNVLIPVKEYSRDRVAVVAKYDPEVVAWITNNPNSDGFVSLILRDFMVSCVPLEHNKK